MNKILRGLYSTRCPKKTLLKEKLITSLRSVFFGTPGMLNNGHDTGRYTWEVN